MRRELRDGVSVSVWGKLVARRWMGTRQLGWRCGVVQCVVNNGCMVSCRRADAMARKWVGGKAESGGFSFGCAVFLGATFVDLIYLRLRLLRTTSQHPTRASVRDNGASLSMTFWLASFHLYLFIHFHSTIPPTSISVTLTLGDKESTPDPYIFAFTSLTTTPLFPLLS